MKCFKTRVCCVGVCRPCGGVTRAPISSPVRWWTGSRPERELRRRCSASAVTRRGRRPLWKAARTFWAWSLRLFSPHSCRLTLRYWCRHTDIPHLSSTHRSSSFLPVPDLHGNGEAERDAVDDQKQRAVSEEAGRCAGQTSSAGGTETRTRPDLAALQVTPLLPQTWYDPLWGRLMCCFTGSDFIAAAVFQSGNTFSRLSD